MIFQAITLQKVTPFAALLVLGLALSYTPSSAYATPVDALQSQMSAGRSLPVVYKDYEDPDDEDIIWEEEDTSTTGD